MPAPGSRLPSHCGGIRARGGRGGEAPVGEAGDAPPAGQCRHSGQSGALIPCCSHRYGVC